MRRVSERHLPPVALIFGAPPEANIWYQDMEEIENQRSYYVMDAEDRSLLEYQAWEIVSWHVNQTIVTCTYIYKPRISIVIWKGESKIQSNACHSCVF